MGNCLPCCYGEREYVPFKDDSNERRLSKRICKRAKNVTVITTSLNTNRTCSYNSRRLKYLLDAKSIPYENIDLATFEVTKYNDHLKEIYRRYPEARREFPILYVDDIFVGNYDFIQNLEDSDDLEMILLVAEFKTIENDHQDCVHCGFTLEELGIEDSSGSFDESVYTYSESGSVYDEYDEINSGNSDPIEKHDYGTFV